MKTRNYRSIASNLFLLSGSFFLSVAIVELILRVQGYSPQLPLPPYLFDNHPVTWWTLRPNFDQTLDTPDGIIRYQINAQGIRAADEIADDPDRFHIFIGGDSFTFGWLNS